MEATRRSTRTPGANRKPKYRDLPKLPSEEKPEPWPPRKLPAGLIYVPPAPEAKFTKADKTAPPQVPHTGRASTEETLANDSDAASDGTLSAPGSPTSCTHANGSRAASSSRAKAQMAIVWDQRRRERDLMVYQRGEPECEVPVSAVRSSWGEEGRAKKRQKMGELVAAWKAEQDWDE
ncbi:hypothetical protein OPT61_g673 [Boeremia exigua]|uniref:Uncharacterized protein n=1 Tax=Boeremia exigua TaxID=749465 RepID=A0ACC2IT73_9PLEO|nr:hypothetical protein OPT61_g673 [Boeremia exigua]